jgi:hypothetical protein
MLCPARSRDEGHTPEWRITLEDVHTRKRYSFANTAGEPEAAVAVGLITPALQKIVTFLGTNDDLGCRDLLWFAAELRRLTDNPERKFTGQPQFANDDDTGSYTLTYEVERF